jgi:predicted TIM-barrel fold metal-dependent hydrolase
MSERIARRDEIGPVRLAEMDAAGIKIQVLSQTASARLDPNREIESAVKANDELAEAISAHPDRFAGFAVLPLADPDASAEELDRTVRVLGFKGALINGMQKGLFLDDPRYWPVFAAAERLSVPIYLHPAEPPASVRNVYYAGLEPSIAQALATSAWGWHVETGLHALRLIVSGIFDRFPTLQLIIGHMGEAIPFMLARTARNMAGAAKLERPLADYFLENFYITTSGMFAVQPLLCLLLVVGADRVIFSVDYPYSSSQEAQEFIESAPISSTDREKIAHLNAERLLGL